MNQITEVGYHYEGLDGETRAAVRGKTTQIREFMAKSVQGILEIGQRLIEVKRCLPHGEFGKWLLSEFNWSESTAGRMMRVAEKFKSVKLTDLKMAPSALYLLAAPSTPEQTVAEVLGRARSGEKITHAKVKRVMRSGRAQTKVEKVRLSMVGVDSRGNGKGVLKGLKRIRHFMENRINGFWPKASAPTEILEAAKIIHGYIQSVIDRMEGVLKGDACAAGSKTTSRRIGPGKGAEA